MTDGRRADDRFIRIEGIYFVVRAGEQERQDICPYEAATDGIRKVFSVVGRIGEYIAVSADGRTILYPLLDQAGSDLMLVENFR